MIKFFLITKTQIECSIKSVIRETSSNNGRESAINRALDGSNYPS
jgi:hypothetical protein